MNKIEVDARAKINITLDVLSKRQDGYHNVKMIMQSINLYDTLCIEKIDAGVEVKTNLPYLPTDHRNIAYKAAQLFFETANVAEAGVGVRIFINKRIPVAAGLAGGSSDAAAVLTAMNTLFDTGFSLAQLQSIGKQLGADVPFCLMDGTALAEGVGDMLTVLPPMPPAIIVLAKPPVSVSTAHVYNHLNLENIHTHPDTEGVINAIHNKDLFSVARGMANVLEVVTAKEHKIINRIKNIMMGNGALGSIMSGSGPTVFGVFEHEAEAYKTVSKLKTVVRDVFMVNISEGNML